LFVVVVVVVVTETYPWIPWELVADALGSKEHSLGATDVGYTSKMAVENSTGKS